MVVPFLRRAHRRRLVLILTFVALLTIYLTYADKHADHRLAHMVPAPSPDGEAVNADGAEEEEEDGQILGLENPPVIPMAYGTAARPPIKGLTNVLLEQPVELLLAGDDDDDDNNDNSVGDDAAAASRVQTPQRRHARRRRPRLFRGHARGAAARRGPRQPGARPFAVVGRLEPGAARGGGAGGPHDGRLRPRCGHGPSGAARDGGGVRGRVAVVIVDGRPGHRQRHGVHVRSRHGRGVRRPADGVDCGGGPGGPGAAPARASGVHAGRAENGGLKRADPGCLFCGCNHPRRGEGKER
ncbi:hypothetical protein SPI_03989 [Niveomyces insectorum RCEF 264]|uniref:Uncharacterized protein n=1 Tax=Niveomyces insectorum RCEF 264 TaxID=1081102 RepID=A0A167VC14_9HYPO|nr:hypothetical protein SPI_03989 [Niveomyces insectorum RCEF 264]